MDHRTESLSYSRFVANKTILESNIETLKQDIKTTLSTVFFSPPLSNRVVVTDNNSEKLFHALDEGADDVVHWAESEHEGYLYERTLDVCHDGVDAAIDFVRYARC